MSPPSLVPKDSRDPYVSKRTFLSLISYVLNDANSRHTANEGIESDPLEVALALSTEGS